MTIVQEKATLPPLKVVEVVHTPWSAHALRAAVEIDLFSTIKKGIHTPADIAKVIQASAHGVELLLNAMVGLEYLSLRENRYQLTALAETYLVSDSPLYMGDYIKRSSEMAKGWYQLADVVKSGKPIREVNEQQAAEEFFPQLAAAIFPMNYVNAQAVARELRAEKLANGARVLDIACGSGVWSIPFVQSNKNISVDALDFPAVLDVTRDFVKRFDVAAQYNYISGNWSEVKLESNAYDVVILGHILHSEGRALSEELIAKAQMALKPGGQLVIAEFLTGPDKTGPVPAALFALNMFMVTTEGCVFSQVELQSILKAKGFAQSRRLEMPGYGKESPILIASK